MSAGEIIALVFTSSVLAAALSVVGNHLLAAAQFRRDYFKEVIRRRLSAYEAVDRLIAHLRVVTYDDRGRVAHLAFAGGRAFNSQTQATVLEVASNGLYVSDDIRQCAFDINLCLLEFRDADSEDSKFEAGVREYERLSALRQRLEAAVARDLQSIHAVKRFLKDREKVLVEQRSPLLVTLPRQK
jgi:hypothetical protein